MRMNLKNLQRIACISGAISAWRLRVNALANEVRGHHLMQIARGQELGPSCVCHDLRWLQGVSRGLGVCQVTINCWLREVAIRKIRKMHIAR